MMRINRRFFVLGLALFLGMAAPAFACGPEENMTHFGTVASVDAEALTLTLMDAETGKPLVFIVTPDQIQAVSMNGRVMIRYALRDGAMVAEEIQT